MDNSTFYSTFDFLPEKWRLWFGIVIVVLALFSVLFNIFVAGTICKFSVLQTPSNMVLASLSLTHFFIGGIAAPLHVLQLLNGELLSNYMFDVVRQYLTTSLIGVATLTLGFMCLDRCQHMVKLRNYSKTLDSVMATLFFCWIVPFLIPLLLKVKDDMHAVVIIIFGTMILLTINMSYIGLVYSLRKLVHNDDKKGKTERAFIRNERRAGTTVFIILSLYTALLIPIFLYHAVCSLEIYDIDVIAKVYLVGMFFVLTTSMVTPVVYISRTPALCSYLIELLCFLSFRFEKDGKWIAPV